MLPGFWLLAKSTNFESKQHKISGLKTPDILCWSKLSQSKRDSLKHYIKHSIPTDAFHLFQPIRDIIENFFIKNKDEETKIINGIVPKSNNFEKTSSLYIKKACGENHKDIEIYYI